MSTKEGSDLVAGALVLLFIFLNLFIGVLLKFLTSKIHIPYTPILLLWGILIGSINSEMNIFGQSVKDANEINPHTILFIFLPALVFESAFSMSWHTFRKEMMQIILLAFPGVALVAILSAISIKYILNYEEFNFLNAFLFGSIMAATDPIAVVSLLKDLGAPKNLSTMIDGESILNDGTAIVLFTVLFNLVTHTSEASAGSIIQLFCSLSLGGLAMGLAIGLIVTFLLGKIYNKPNLEVCLIFVAAYLLFFICEYLELHFSGVLALLSYGLFMSGYGKTNISPSSEEALHAFWGFACFCAETLIFVLSGSIIGLRLKDLEIHSEDWGYLIIFYLLMNLNRAIMVLIFYPFLKYYAYGFDWKKSVVLVFGGLRGAVALALALKIYLDEYFTAYYPEAADKILFFTAGFICLTLIINAPLSPWVIKILDIIKPNYSQMGLYDQIIIQLEEYTNKIIDKKLKKSKFLNTVDWDEVKTLVFNKEYNEAKNKYTKLKEKIKSKKVVNEELFEARFRYMKITKSLYWKYFLNGFCAGFVTVQLMESADQSLDGVENTLDDWNYLKKNILNNFLDKILFKMSTIKILMPITKKITHNKLIRNYDAITNYIKAHLIAKEKIKDYHFSPETVLKIESEININVHSAKEYLNEFFYISYPNLVLNVQTLKAANITLNFQIEYVKENYEKGLLTDKEFSMLIDSLENNAMNLKKSIISEKETSISSFLNNIAFFKLGFEPKQLEKIISESTEQTFGIKEQVFKINDEIRFLYVVKKGALVESNDYHTRFLEYTNILNARFIMNPKTSTTMCISSSETILVKIPMELIENNVTRNVMYKIYKEEILEVVRFRPQNFQILSQINIMKLKKIIKECAFEKCKKGEVGKFLNGMIILSGEGKRIESYKNGNMVLELQSVPAHIFYLDNFNDEGIFFTENSSLFILSNKAKRMMDTFKKELYSADPTNSPEKFFPIKHPREQSLRKKGSFRMPSNVSYLSVAEIEDEKNLIYDDEGYELFSVF